MHEAGVRANMAPMRSERHPRPRLFHFLAAAFAVVAILAWGRLLAGAGWGGQLEPLAWHQHEMVFGFALAVLAGWLLGERPPAGHAGADAGAVAMIALAVAWFLARILQIGRAHV